MRSLLELVEFVAALLFPAHGKHRASAPPSNPLPARPKSSPSRRIIVQTCRPMAQIFDGDATAMVRPYVLATEGAGW